MTHFVKFREKGKRAFWFLTPNQTANRLRIYAAMFPDKQSAEQTATKLAQMNPGHEFKAVKA